MTSTKRAQPLGLRRRNLLDGLRRTSLLDAAQDGDSKKSDDSEATGEIARFKSIGRYGPARAEKLLPYEVRGDLEEEVEADINPMPTLAEYFDLPAETDELERNREQGRTVFRYGHGVR